MGCDVPAPIKLNEILLAGGRVYVACYLSFPDNCQLGEACGPTGLCQLLLCSAGGGVRERLSDWYVWYVTDRVREAGSLDEGDLVSLGMDKAQITCNLICVHVSDNWQSHKCTCWRGN